MPKIVRTILIGLALSGCASMFQGSRQNITIAINLMG
jgi:hypothetical protein